jgi:hypothetical protein
MFKVASWNLNSVRSRLTHVTTWLKVREPDVLLLQELKGTEFPFEAYKSLGYESVHGRSPRKSALSMASADPILPAHGLCFRIVQKRRSGAPRDELLCCRPSPFCGN